MDSRRSHDRRAAGGPLMKMFATPTQVGVWQTFLVLAAGYFVF